MAIREIQYAWLTGALDARDDFFGDGSGFPLPFLLRHGIAGSTRRNRHVTSEEEARFVQTGGRHFYLAAVESRGRPLDLEEAYFLPSLVRGGVVVGPRLFDGLKSICDLDVGYSLPIDRSFVSAHAWHYELPSIRTDNSLYLRLFVALQEQDLAAVGGDDDLMRKLCDRYPALSALPQMHLILPPSLVKNGITKAWEHDEIVITSGAHVRVRTRHGDLPITRELLRLQPVLKYEGLLIPPSAATLFNTGSDCGWPALTCIKNITFRFKESE